MDKCKKYISIAIDGPSGAGKSTLAKNLAKKMNFIYIDTGAMYRAVAYYCILNNIDLKNSSQLKSFLDEIKLNIRYENNEQKVYLNNKDITEKLRTQEVADIASKCAEECEVRKKLVNVQRNLALKSNVVMEGRDIGSHVLPDATLKIYLDASVDKRTLRRSEELKEKGIFAEYDIIKKEIEERDYRDINRKYTPLVKCKDAKFIDTTNMTSDEVIDKIISYYSNLKKEPV